MKLAKARGDQELADLLLAGEIRRDLIVEGRRVGEAQVDAQIREITLDIDKRASMLRAEQRRADEEFRLEIEDRRFKQQHAARLAQIEANDTEMRSMVVMQIEMGAAKHERTMAARRQEIDTIFRKMQVEIDDRFQQRRLKLDESVARMGMMERLVSQGLGTGAADSTVLNTMLQQSTEQEYATTSDEKVRARAEGQAASNSLETYKQAEDRERQHDANTTGLASDMMQAAKQVPPATVITGGVMPLHPVIADRTIPPPAVASGSAVTPDAATMQPTHATSKATSACASCGEGIETGWNNCPNCGDSLVRSATGKCPTCGNRSEPEWKTCPMCGADLGAGCI